MPRIALGLEYDGSSFAGWQSQTHALGIQSVVEAALSRVADHPVSVTAAGRTDAGVHATSQVVHFDARNARSERSWVLGANTNLDPQISVHWAREVPADFHARYSALSRHYRYRILNQQQRPSLERLRACWIRQPLDHCLMHEAAQSLVGLHDFSSFRSAQCQSPTPVRCLEAITIERFGNYVVLNIIANAFLHHMVRNIAGVLIAIGRCVRPVGWTAEVLQARDRTKGGVTAASAGLYLVGVKYDAIFGLPSWANLPVVGGPRIDAAV